MYDADKNTKRVYDRYFSLQTDTPDLFISVGVGEKGEWKYFKEKFPQCQFLGFEPHPVVRERVAPHFPGLMLPYALGDRYREVQMSFLADTKLSSVLPYNFEKGGSLVQQISVSPFFDALLWEFKNIFLWMDIEGHELNALRGFSPTQLDKVKWMNLEWRPEECMTRDQQHWCTKKQLWDWTALQGYSVVLEYNKMLLESGGHCDALLERIKP